MIRNLIDLYSSISQSPDLEGVKIFFDHIEIDQNETLDAPYIVITNTSEPPFFADDVVYYSNLQGEVIFLYKQFEDSRKSVIEKILNDGEIIFTISHEFDDDIRLFVTRYAYEIAGGDEE